MPSLEKSKRKLNYKTHQKHSLARNPENSWRLHKKQNLLPNLPKQTKIRESKRRKLPSTYFRTTPIQTSRLAKIHTRNKTHTTKTLSAVQTLNQWLNITRKKTSQYIETNPSKQPPREEIRTISLHNNPNKNQPNPKNLSKEFTLSSPNTQNRTTPLTETEQNQMKN